MKNSTITYLGMIAFHAGLGLLLFILPVFAKFYGLLALAASFFIIIKNKNRNQEVLLASAYLVSIEVLLRMHNGVFFNEQGKYGVMIFMFLGMYYRGFSKNSLVYCFFILLLLPGVVIATSSLSLDVNIRKAIAFNISGPACLAISAIYCYRREISFDKLNQIVVALSMPLVALLAYLFLYTPSIKEVVTGTNSNFETSGGFGPNQVSTVLGLGIFVFFALLLFYSKSKKIVLLHLFLVLLVAFRGIITFSRGGVITGVVMVLALLFIVFLYAKSIVKVRVFFIGVGAALAAMLVWGYSSSQTGGLIDRRYANEDARGREKDDRLGGREEIAKTELQMFLDNPILGIGVGRNKEVRKELTGIKAASHNEVTRLLAEHGAFGVMALLILLFTPLILSIDNRQHLYLFPFFIFWLLTINHAAMRIAAPAFIYALSLLKVYTDEKPALHRRPAV